MQIVSTTIASPPLRFGWGPEQHDSIERQTASVIGAQQPKSSSLGGFLLEWMPEINQRSLFIDLPPKKGDPVRPCDSINLDTGGKRPDGMEKAILPHRNTPLSEVSPHFKPGQEKRFRALDWKTAVAYKTTGEGYTGNVLRSSYQSYRKVAFLLSIVEACPPEHRKELQKVLVVCLGDLFQYLGDVCQPLHVSTFCNWKLPYGFTETEANGLTLRRWPDGAIKRFNGIHSFTEGQMVTEGLKLSPFRLRQLRSENIPERLLGTAKQAYEQMFALVRAAEKAEDATSEAEYFRLLKQGVQPIAQKQMSKAVQLCAEVLNAAYAEAGSPDLSVLFKERLNYALAVSG